MIRKILAITLAMACLCGLLSGCEKKAIESLAFNNTKSQEITIGGLNIKDWVIVEPSSFDEADIKFISTNPDVATITEGTKTVGALWFEIEAVKAGKTTIYAQTKDGSVKSEEITITIKGEDWIESLRFNNPGNRSTKGDSYKDWVVVEPGRYNPDKLTFKCSDETIATVHKDTTAHTGQWFEVVKIKEGTVTITVETDNGVKSDELILTFE